jgi:hypothetical protein
MSLFNCMRLKRREVKPKLTGYPKTKWVEDKIMPLVTPRNEQNRTRVWIDGSIIDDIEWVLRDPKVIIPGYPVSCDCSEVDERFRKDVYTVFFKLCELERPPYVEWTDRESNRRVRATFDEIRDSHTAAKIP